MRRLKLVHPAWCLALLVAGLGMLAPRPAWSQISFWDAYESGRTALEAGRVDEAIRDLKEAIRLHPASGKRVRLYGTNFVSDYYPYTSLGAAYLKAGKADEAAKVLHQALAAGVEPKQPIAELLSKAGMDVARSEVASPPSGESATPPKPRPLYSQPGESNAAQGPPGPQAVVHFLSTPPGAHVLLDGVPRGVTPLDLQMRPEGEHVVVLSLPGFRDEKRAFALRPGDELTVDAPLAPVDLAKKGNPEAPETPIQGEIELRVQPAGTEVYVDGTSRGQMGDSGVLILPLPPGDHALRLTHPGYQEAETTIRVMPGIRSLFTWHLEATPTPVPNAASLSHSRTSHAAAWFLLLLALACASVWVAWRFTNHKRLHPLPVSTRPRSVGPYILHEKLGGGGMSEVWEAERRGGQQRVALKLPLPPYNSDAQFRKRFFQEADIGKRLDHPGIVPILDCGEHAGQLFLAMELVEGRTLRHKLDNLSQPLPPAEACTLAREVAAILEYTHEQGVIHRDLKPENIILERGSERVRVADFGVARVADATSYTVTGQMLGTPRYMAPEPLLHLPYTPQSDLYSLGVILYEMLTLRLPFDGDNFLELAQKHCETERPRPSRLNPFVSPELDGVVIRLMAVQPADRFLTASDLVSAIDALMAAPAFHLSTPLAL